MSISFITGGAGFLGTNLSIRLMKLGHKVYCLDNLETSDLGNLELLKKYKNFHFILGDVIDHDLIQVIKESIEHVDYIWHLACPASPPKYQKNGYKTIKTNVIGTMNVLELVEKWKCKMLFTSTSEIYGDPLEHPQKESYWGNVNTVGPRSCYDEGKRCAETIIYQFREQFPRFNKHLKIVRIFNTFGPYMDLNDGRVVTNFIQSILKNEPLKIYGDGSQTRSFCYVDDIIEGFISFMMSNEIGPLNLGNPEEYSILELKKVFEEILGIENYPIKNLELPINDPTRRKPDISLAEDKLAWKPKTKVIHGLRKTLDHFRNFFI